MAATKTAQLEIVLEGTEHPYGISAESLAAVMPQPITTWRPLRLIVTDRCLRSDEKRGGLDLGADAILTTKTSSLESLPGSKDDNLPDQRHAGAAVDPRLDSYNNSLAEEVADSYSDNVVLGHGPKAVAAAAERAATVLDEAPLQDLSFWLGGTIIGLALSIAALAYSLSRRRRREQLFHRLTKAQSQLAAGVLELEALEASYWTAQKQGGTAGLDTTWTDIREDTLALARTEDATMAAVYSARTALRIETETMVSQFERSAQTLEQKAAALSNASTVWSGFKGSSGVLDQLAMPIALAGRALLVELNDRPPGVIAEHRVKWLSSSLESLLSVPGSGTGGTETLAAWGKAELELLRSAKAAARTLVKKVRGPVPPPAPATQDFSQLRKSMGLPPTLSQDVLSAMETAMAALPLVVARNHEPLPRTDSRRTPSTRATQTPVEFLREKSTIFVGGGAILVLSFLASTFIVAASDDGPTSKLAGQLPPASVQYDGDTSNIDIDLIEGYFQNSFSDSVHITVAVRDAKDYLGIPGHGADHGPFEEIDPEKFLAALWRIKAEFPQLHDQHGLELQLDQAIIPVFRSSGNFFSAPTVLPGAVSRGEAAWNGNRLFGLSKIYFSNNGGVEVGSAMRDLARGLQNNNYAEPQISEAAKLLLLTTTIALSLALLAMAAIYVSAMSTRLGRFGVRSAELRYTNKELDRLLLGLDETRINAVAILGTGPSANSAETEQRIFESALTIACRQRDALAATPLAGRLDGDYSAQVERFVHLVAALTGTDSDVERRSQKLLAGVRTAR
ncbi:hypothetical protein JOF48_003218 [Arthrobacter stackebrandtii]|uniref:DUF5129 domain-containing protein n=1 Tax=Arthrobacter stackebrandtii TaxID=272161 RepID=A0ABS4Z0D7_9MICC|nr:hypothetical protein [Arthrobacter stackebrandtii]MBP2414419.1 hypothetical protein [Arthrobacter stackebrandtii]